MIVGVVSDIMAFLHNPLDKIGVSFGVLADHEKRSRYVFVLEDVQDQRSIQRIGAVVKGEGNKGQLRVPHPEKLRLQSKAPVDITVKEEETGQNHHYTDADAPAQEDPPPAEPLLVCFRPKLGGSSSRYPSPRQVWGLIVQDNHQPCQGE